MNVLRTLELRHQTVQLLLGAAMRQRNLLGHRAEPAVIFGGQQLTDRARRDLLDTLTQIVLAPVVAPERIDMLGRDHEQHVADAMRLRMPAALHAEADAARQRACGARGLVGDLMRRAFKLEER